MRFIKALVIISIFSLNTAFALQSDFKEQIFIDSDQQMADLSENQATFLNDVIIRQGTIEIHADKVIVEREKTGELKVIKAFGKPATFHQILDNKKPIDADGQQLIYYPSKQTIELIENAHIVQEKSEIKGDKITYNIVKEKMEAFSSKNNTRVTSVFIPEQLKQQINDSKNNK